MSVVEPGGSGDAPVIEDGLYEATITAVKDVTLDEPDRFGNQDKVEIQVTFTDSEGEIQTLDPRVNRKWGEKATLFTIAIACGIDANPFDPFDTDSLVNRNVRVLIETPEEGKWPRVKSWSKTSKKSGGQPATATPAAPPLPSVVNPDGGPAYDVFWKVIGANGIEKSTVFAHVGGPEAFTDLDGPDVQRVMEELVSIAMS